MPGYLQAPDRGGHPLRWRRIIAGQASALRPARPASSRILPLAAARALMCGAEGGPVLRHGAGQAGAIDDGLDSIPVTARAGATEPPAPQPGPPRRRNIAPVCGMERGEALGFYDKGNGVISSTYQAMIVSAWSSSHRLMRSISNERSTLPGQPGKKALWTAANVIGLPLLDLQPAQGPVGPQIGQL